MPSNIVVADEKTNSLLAVGLEPILARAWGVKIPSPRVRLSRIPRLEFLKKTTLNINKDSLKSLPTSELFTALKNFLSTKNKYYRCTAELSTPFECLQEIAQRNLVSCNLCAYHCGIDRRSQRGKCGLLAGTFAETFVNVAEELGPSVVLNFSGCAWNCSFCSQKHLLLHDQNNLWSNNELIPLSEKKHLWDQITIKYEEARISGYIPIAITIAGGNPSESLPMVIDLLDAVPKGFRLPITIQTNGYDGPISVLAWSLISDGIIQSFKFGNSECARNHGAPLDSLEVGLHNWSEYISGSGKSTVCIARLLLLPGHFDCCFTRIVYELKQFDKKKFWVTLLDDYVPIYNGLGKLSKFNSLEEKNRALRLLKQSGFLLTT